jgi:hypothetical protein
VLYIITTNIKWVTSAPFFELQCNFKTILVFSEVGINILFNVLASDTYIYNNPTTGKIRCIV